MEGCWPSWSVAAGWMPRPLRISWLHSAAESEGMHRIKKGQGDGIRAHAASSHKRGRLTGEHVPEPFHVRFHDVHARDVVPREIAVIGGFVAQR